MLPYCCRLRDELSTYLNYLVDLQDKIITKDGNFITYKDKYEGVVKFIRNSGKEKLITLNSCEVVCCTCCIHFEKLSTCYKEMLYLTDEDIY